MFSSATFCIQRIKKQVICGSNQSNSKIKKETADGVEISKERGAPYRYISPGSQQSLTAPFCFDANIHDRMKYVYGNNCTSDGIVQCRVRQFGRCGDPKDTNVNDRKLPDEPLSASNSVYQQAVDCMFEAYIRVKKKRENCKWNRSFGKSVPYSYISPGLLQSF